MPKRANQKFKIQLKSHYTFRNRYLKPRNGLTFLKPRRSKQNDSDKNVLPFMRGKMYKMELEDLQYGWKDALPEHKYGVLKAQMLQERARLQELEKRIEHAFDGLPNVSILRVKKSPVWTEDDKYFLKMAIDEHGTQNFDILAKLVGTKTPMQVQSYHSRQVELKELERDNMFKVKIELLEMEPFQEVDMQMYQNLNDINVKIKIENDSNSSMSEEF